MLESRYDHKSVEEKIYRLWEESGYFNPDNLPLKKNAKPFTIIMPPPNANGHLHAGHALFITLEDIMTRYYRMRGHKALWVPGADHAGFETQIVYERQLEKEGRSRFKMDPQQLFDEIMAFTLKNKKFVEDEVRSLGASCDWSREKFTLDPNVIAEVQKTFEKIYNDGLIYRGKRPVNWCTKHRTSLSDVETESKEITDMLYYLEYGPLTVATVRPETIFGDVAVAVNPKDKRYKKYIGTTIEAKIPGKTLLLKVIGDETVEMKFGTGALKITPAHDANDFAVAERHKLPLIEVIDEHGKLNEKTGKYAGMKIKEAREAIVHDLKEIGVLKKTESYSHTVPVCYKCGNTIEPRVMDQWFVKMQPLAKLALNAVKKGKVKFIPDRFRKVFEYWMKNTIDWNISRQIVWGIRIPAWFCLNCKKTKINPEIKARWYIVRHGETDWNKNGKIQGKTDVPLNESGRTQVQNIAQVLKTKKIDLIITSDLKRAQETADIIYKATGAEILIDAKLQERDIGKAEGMQREEAIQKFGNLYVYEDKSAENESYKEVEERAWKAFANHQTSHKHKNVVIVTHGAVMRMLVKRIKNLSIEETFARKPVRNGDIVQLDILKPCENCGGESYEQDPDTLDTWFSSGQWPLITLNYPNGKDFKTYYPTDVMETGYDLVFKWVPRMVIFGLYLTKEIPFRTVYLHGLVNDAQGKKMSKSKGNVISPIELTEKYGTDALRIGLVVGNTPGTDLALSEDKIRGYRNFSTKIWNVARFTLMNKPGSTVKPKPSAIDKKNLKELERIKKEIADHIEKFEFHLAAEKAYHYVWHTFADKIIEEAKSRLQGNDAADKAAAYATIETILVECLKILHPFMPFVTEEIYQQISEARGERGKLLMVEPW